LKRRHSRNRMPFSFVVKFSVDSVKNHTNFTLTFD